MIEFKFQLGDYRYWTLCIIAVAESGVEFLLHHTMKNHMNIHVLVFYLGFQSDNAYSIHKYVKFQWTCFWYTFLSITTGQNKDIKEKFMFKCGPQSVYARAEKCIQL